MTHSNNANSGCFSAMLRRLLCSSNLPTHPSDSMTESNGGEFEKQTTEVKDGVLPTREIRPGVVAQLMGLNSLPDSNWVPKKRSPDSVSRSKSVNFVDYLLEFDDRNQSRHRRVRTASFREVSPAPATFLNQENELLVVYMKGFEGKEKEIGLNMKKSELGFGEMKQGKEKSNNLVKKKMKISKLKDEPRREIGKKCLKNRKKCNGSKDSLSVLPSYKKQSFNKHVKSSQKKKIIQKEASSGKKPEKKSRTGTETGTKNKKKKKNVMLEPDCESPISVLEFSKKTENCDDEMEENVMKKKDYDGYCEMVGRICRLAEEDIREGNWMDKNMYEFEGLCIEIERHVVNMLLAQIYDDLV